MVKLEKMVLAIFILAQLDFVLVYWFVCVFVCFSKSKPSEKFKSCIFFLSTKLKFFRLFKICLFN